MEKELEKVIHDALKEDCSDKDLTSLAIIDPKKEGFGNFVVKASGVVSGTEIIKEVYRQINPKIKVNIVKNDGEYVHKGDVIAAVSGRMNDIIKGETVVLNFLQIISGVATITDKYAEELKGTNCMIRDTRLTTPLLRKFEKLAVIHGNGENSRFNLSDQVLIRDYHIAMAGSIIDAVDSVRSKYGYDIIVEVEVSTEEEYHEALDTDCDIIMLNNMSNEMIALLCSIPHKGKKIEVSGNISIGRLRSIAMLGIDYISIDSLSHGSKGLDICFKFLKKTYK